jgi:hypothetical protein
LVLADMVGWMCKVIVLSHSAPLNPLVPFRV